MGHLVAVNDERADMIHGQITHRFVGVRVILWPLVSAFIPEASIESIVLSV